MNEQQWAIWCQAQQFMQGTLEQLVMTLQDIDHRLIEVVKRMPHQPDKGEDE